MRSHRLLALPCAGFLALLTGCPNPDLYTTPRTLNPGAVQWQVAPEFIYASYNVTTSANGTSTTNSASVASPMIPTVAVRVGVADGVEIGARVPNLDSLGVDGKFRLLKGSFDLAIDPGVQGYYISVNNVGLGVLYLHVPLLMGLNLSDTTTLVATPGFVYSVVTASESGSNGVSGAATASGVMGRLGLGLDVRVSKKLAIHPEVTVMHQFSDQNALLVVGGFGFNIGPQPDYSDLAGGGVGAPPVEGK
jgi:hypothetical protein